MLLLRGKDERGRAIRNLGGGSTMNSSVLQTCHRLKIPAGAKKADLTFAIHSSRFVEFRATPTILHNL